MSGRTSLRERPRGMALPGTNWRVLAQAASPNLKRNSKLHQFVKVAGTLRDAERPFSLHFATRTSDPLMTFVRTVTDLSPALRSKGRKTSKGRSIAVSSLRRNTVPSKPCDFSKRHLDDSRASRDRPGRKSARGAEHGGSKLNIELNRLVLAHSPKFRALLDHFRRQIEQTGGVPHEHFWREVEADTACPYTRFLRLLLFKFFVRVGQNVNDRCIVLISSLNRCQRRKQRIHDPETENEKNLIDKHASRHYLKLLKMLVCSEGPRPVISESSRAAPRYLADLLQNGTPAGLSDAELLDRFASRRNVQDETAELAFAAILARHGPMVLRVCRAVLGSRPEVDDAFQATFLVLAVRLPSIRRRDSVASWLHGVALRVAAAERSRSRADGGMNLSGLR